MSDLVFNLRIGKFHIQIDERRRIHLALNDYHRWLRWPLFQLY